jgi:hypothetical protein
MVNNKIVNVNNLHTIRDIPKSVYLVKTRARTILGSKSSVFGFKNKDDATKIQQIIENDQQIIVWHTMVRENKYMVFAPPKSALDKSSCIVCPVFTESIVNEIAKSSLSLRLVESIEKENWNIYSLYSNIEIGKDIKYSELISYFDIDW